MSFLAGNKQEQIESADLKSWNSADLKSSLHDIGFLDTLKDKLCSYMERFPACTESVFKRMRSFGAPSPGGQGGRADTDASMEVRSQAALDLI